MTDLVVYSHEVGMSKPDPRVPGHREGVEGLDHGTHRTADLSQGRPAVQ
ncbi:MAG: hypothetical protein ACRDN9_06830 [Streptosporangiaceae bacterium]